MSLGVLAPLLDADARGRAARGFRLVHHLLLALGLAATMESTLRLTPLFDEVLQGVVLLVAGFFLTEWLLRLLAAPWLPPALPARSAARRRLRYLVSCLGLVDLLAACLLPLLLLRLSGEGVGSEAVLLPAMLWVLKLLRYVPGFALIGRVLQSERDALLSVLAAFGMVLLLAATMEYLLEHEGQPETFGSLPAALWWCIATLTTTGYGDAVPATAAGRVVAGLVMIAGIAIFALWAGILASGFAAEVRRRDFLRTWALVAKVPLFRSLGAGVIAEVARLLKPRRLPAGALLMRRGEPGDCMYFIVSGQVEVRLEPRPVRLDDGAFLGEMALVTGAPRSADVVTTAATQFLVLDIAAFREVAGHHPELLRVIEAEAAGRAALLAESPTPAR